MDGDKLRAMKVLLVDDDQSIRVAMEYYFKKKTRTFFTVEDAEIALKFLNKEVWDIIICDYKLPGMNGIDFFKMVDLNVIKILITAYASNEVASKARRAGIHDKRFIGPPDRTTLARHAEFKIIEKITRGRE